jgi:hypothetical protein
MKELYSVLDFSINIVEYLPSATAGSVHDVGYTDLISARRATYSMRKVLP